MSWDGAPVGIIRIQIYDRNINYHCIGIQSLVCQFNVVYGVGDSFGQDKSLWRGWYDLVDVIFIERSALGLHRGKHGEVDYKISHGNAGR